MAQPVQRHCGHDDGAGDDLLDPVVEAELGTAVVHHRRDQRSHQRAADRALSAGPWQIQGNDVDFVVEVPSLGDASKIVSGTTRITRSPDRMLIAELVARFTAEAGTLLDSVFRVGRGQLTIRDRSVPRIATAVDTA